MLPFSDRPRISERIGQLIIVPFAETTELFISYCFFALGLFQLRLAFDLAGTVNSEITRVSYIKYCV